MREYELTFIVEPELEQAALEDVIEKVKSWVSDEGGEISKVNIWGERRLAYPIRKKNQGQYILIESKMPPAACQTMERNFRLLEPVMRFLIARKE